MNGNGYMEVHYVNNDGSFPYNGNESFVNFFEDHTHMPMNCVSAAPMHDQENMCWSMHMNPYTFGSSSYGTDSYYSSYEVNDHLSRMGISGREWEYPSMASIEEPSRIEDTQTEAQAHAHAETSVDEYHEEGTPDDQNPDTSEDVWQDTIDPDNMTYEELLDLGEAIGTQSRGLSQELIGLLPTSIYKFGGLFSKKRSGERCVICQTRYKIGDRQMKLPCKHVYHGECISKWLSINKVCPVCNVEVFGEESRH